MLVSDVKDVTKESSEVVRDSSESDYILPSSEKDVFLNDDLEVLLKICAPVIEAGPISKSRIGTELQRSVKGRKFLQSYTLFQLQNRLKYERRKAIGKQ